MSKIVPLICSGTPGSLGLLHLPRLWLKALLAGCGKLAEGYKDVGPGFDFMVLEGIGIDPVKARDFIHSKKPTYPEFEKWISSQPGVKLDAATIAKVNASVTGYNHADDVRKTILDASNLPDEGNILDAVSLNAIDDWQAFHSSVTKS